MAGVEGSTQGGVAPEDRHWSEFSRVSEGIDAQFPTLTGSGGGRDTGERVGSGHLVNAVDFAGGEGGDRGQLRRIGCRVKHLGRTKCRPGGLGEDRVADVSWLRVQRTNETRPSQSELEHHEATSPPNRSRIAGAQTVPRHLYDSLLMTTEAGAEAQSIIVNTPSDNGWKHGGNSFTASALRSHRPISS